VKKTRDTLIGRIKEHIEQVRPGHPDEGLHPNPLVEAYDRYPTVRTAVDALRTDTREDLATHRPTATAVDTILRTLEAGRRSAA